MGKGLLKSYGLRAYEAFNDEGQPLCIIPRDASDDGFGLTIFTDGGKITGVVVYDSEDDFKTVGVFGEIPEGFEPWLGEDADERVDAVTGESGFAAGWIVAAPARGETWDFASLTSISEALFRGTFGIRVTRQIEDGVNVPVLESAEDMLIRETDEAEAALADVIVAALNEDEPFPSQGNGEPLGWAAPELQPKASAVIDCCGRE